MYLIHLIFELCIFSKLFMSPVNAEQQSNYHIKQIRTNIMESVIEFAYTLNCDINETNLWELLTTADYFCYSLLIDRCIAYICSILNVKNCIHLLVMTRFEFNFFFLNRIFFFAKWINACFVFRKWLYKHDIERIIKEYILHNFVEISQTNEDILNVSIDDLVDIIGNDVLNTKSEEPIWELCLRWIEFDEKNRPKYIPRLLTSIRLGLMNRAVRHHYLHFHLTRYLIMNFAVLWTAGVKPQICAIMSRGGINYTHSIPICVSHGSCWLVAYTWWWFINAFTPATKRFTIRNWYVWHQTIL